MTTATRRLRRGGVAGLAAAVTAGVAIIATAGSAFAAELAVTTQVGAVGATTVYPGSAATAVGDLQISIPNNFHIGDTITVQLAGAGASCGTTNGAIGYSAAPTATATGPFTAAFGTTAGSSTDTAVPTFTSVLQSSAGACTTANVKDQLLVTLTSSSTGVVGDQYTLSLTGTNVNIGSAVTPGAVTEKPASGLVRTVATVANTKAAVSAVTTAVSSLAAQGVGLGTLTLSDVGAAQVIVPPIFLSAPAGTTFNAVLPTVVGPSGTTWTVTANGGDTVLTLTPTGTIPTTNNTYTVSGLSLLIPAGVGTYAVTAAFGGASPGTTTIGAAVTVAVASAQQRLGGVDRYASSAQLFNSQFPTVSDVVLASGANFPDALSATYLAKTLTPATGVLLTDPNVLQQATSLVLTNGHITTVYIVGGTAAVSANVQNAISGLHVGNNPGTGALLTVVRVSGADRYATNNAVDLYNGGTVSTPTAILASGENYPDALAVGPAVYNKTIPLVLTNQASLNATAASTLVNLGVHNVIIVGGTAAVATAAESAVHTAAPSATVTYRIAGADRTLTASMISTWETQGLAATTTYTTALTSLAFSYTASTVYLADGTNFPDALSAGAVAGSQARVILLTADPNNLGSGASSYLGTATLTHVAGIIAVGLTAAVSVATYNAAVAAL